MASSSSSSNFNSASDSHSWKYEVFISFRGEDTRKGFVDHLYKALVQQGILTYKDDVTLPRGSTIGPALFKAIQESRIAVIVFSENYANSSWCLDELAYIVECMENKGQIVLPVFYDVDPSDVRKQNGIYGEAFTKHERDNKHKVDSWRNALLKAGNLSGWVPKEFANGHEAKCIEDIVATIFNRLSLLIANVNKDLIGIKTRLKNLKSMLKIGSSGVRMVGIWGVGGGGKTTLASAAYMELSSYFEACCLLENIREESSKHGLQKLQENMLSHVLKKDVRVGSEMEGKSIIKRSLCHKSILVVLDDVNDRKQLEALAGAYDWFGEGSRIIITTRDKHLLTLKNATICEVSLLSAGESLKLFCRHAFKKDEPLEDYKTLSELVVSYANSLPLALEVLGSSLYDQDKEVWKGTLAKLRRIPNPDVTKTLKVSYDALEPDEKQLFLDIACFMRRWEINDAMRVLDACNFEPRIGIKVLAQKSLIKVSNEIFEMHDLVEEMALYIVRGEHPDNPEKHSRIWMLNDIKAICATGTAASEAEVLALQDYRHTRQIFGEAFKKKKKRFWCREPVYENDQGLPNVIANMKKLRWIDWEGYPPSSFPSNFLPTRLACLTLKSTHQKQLWKGCKSLPSLKILDLQNSWSLKRTPDFTGLPCLERLNLEDCRELEEIHPSIGYHKRLVWVNMKDCRRLKWFPPIIQMMKLETLVLSNCRKLKTFRDIQTSMDRLSLPSLKIIDLQHSHLERTPDFTGLPCLERLNLEACTELKEIHPSIGYHKRLVWVNMEGCLSVKWFPPIIHMIKLETLVLSHCHQLKTFPEIQTNMDSLSLPSLKILDLQNSWSLKRTPDFTGLPCLERLNLEACTELKEIHPSIGYHKRLVWVNMKDCRRLKWFPPIIQMMKLETLVLSKCWLLENFPDIQTSMDSLVNLHMDETDIEIVPHSVGQFCTNLVTLDLEKCRRLKRIEGNFRLLKRLKHLRISGCIRIENFEEDFFGDECCLAELPQFPWISKKLDLRRCNLGNGDITLIISKYVNLQILDLRGNKFSRLPSGFSEIPCLKVINLSYCQNLVELSDLPSSIAIIIAEYCESLQSIGDLSNCKWLWEVSFYRHEKNNLIGVERVVHSMVQRNAVEDRFVNIVLPLEHALYSRDHLYKKMTLQLPDNWCNDFSGFLLSADDYVRHGCNIYIKHEMLSMDSQPDHHHWSEYDKILESYKECKVLGYVPFASLRHTSWWNTPRKTHITFDFHALDNPKVGLVPRKSKSRETPIHYSEYWEKEIYNKETFRIKNHPGCSHIEWTPEIWY